MTMFTYLFISGLCLLLLLHIVCKFWQDAVEIHSTADNLDKGRELAARREQATKDPQRNASRTVWLHTSPLNTAMSGNKAMTPPTRCSRGPMPGIRRSLACNRIVTTSDGVPLSVRDWGSHDAGHTIVLLHGFCLNKESWNIQITQLIRRWNNNIRIISYDHRGHGDSGNAPMHTYRIDRLADDLAELLVALGVTGPLTLVGHSMGGMTALAYLGRPATKRPVEPESLVLVATAAGNLGSHGLGRLLSTPAPSMLYHLIHHMPRAGTDEVVQFLARPVCAALTRHSGYGEAAPKSLVDASAAAINATPSTTKVGFLPGLKDYDCSQALSSITAKTTMISGGADKLTPMCHARKLAAGIPGAMLICRPTAGHTLLHEVPQLVTGAITCAIAGDSPVPAQTSPVEDEERVS
jgi:pimeloyl-ACP methyl ester carboxylesterase